MGTRKPVHSRFRLRVRLIHAGKGEVSKLAVFLRNIGNRPEDPIRFDNVRFVFIVPYAKLKVFQLPNALATLMGRNQLMDLRFTGFEEMGAIPTCST